MRWVLAGATTAALLAAAPAQACMTMPPPVAVLFDQPPSHRPPGHVLLKVVGWTVEQDDEHLLVKIVEPARARRLGTFAWLRATYTSCTTWGRLRSEAYVVARVAGRLRGRILLDARSYGRSRWNLFWGSLGWTRFRADGPPMES